MTHRAMWTHGGQMSAQNGPRSTTRILVTRLTSTWNFETQPFGQAPDFVMAMQNTPTHITKAEMSRSETATRCMNAQKRNNAKLNAAASSMLLTHVETQSAPTGGIRHLTPCRVLEQSIAQPQPRQTEPPSSLTQEPHWSADQRRPRDTPVGLLLLPCSDTRRHCLLKGKTYLTMAEKRGHTSTIWWATVGVKHHTSTIGCQMNCIRSHRVTS